MKNIISDFMTALRKKRREHMLEQAFAEHTPEQRNDFYRRALDEALRIVKS